MASSRLVELIVNYMNQCFCRCFAAALLVSTLSASLEARASEQVNRLADLLQTSKVVEKDGEFSGNQSLGADQRSASPQSTSTRSLDEAIGVTELMRVISHPLDEDQAATLYVDNIPVLTFIDTDQPQETPAPKQDDIADQSAAPDTDAPTSLALDAARKLDDFYSTSGNPESILARWDENSEAYVVALSDETLVVINDQVMLPDTTHNHAEDTLQAANRLRRLLGGAAPLTEIEGAPEPEPEPQVAVGSSWDVTSVFTGQASWYGPGFHGRRTASGEVFNQHALTAAHRTLPFGTQVRVTNLRNNRQVIVRINDRGPFSHGRILDLSASAAREIGLDRAGVGPVRIEVISD